MATINVPFLYRALIIKPRCRKPVETWVRDEMMVEIKEVAQSEAPLAFRLPKQEILMFDNKLWDFDYESFRGEKSKKVTLDTVIANTADVSGYRWSSNGADAPFHNIWNRVEAKWDKLTEIVSSKWLKDDVSTLEDIVYRELVDTNRAEVMDVIRKKANASLSIDGVMFTHASEPRYYAICFGLGSNHGGTSLSVTSHYNSNIVGRAYFRADEFKKALAYATELATNRGDTESIKKFASQDIIEILIPEAVRLNPAVDHPVE